MPPKQSSLSKSTAKAQALQQARASESTTQHAARLQLDQERHSAARAGESPAQHAARLQASQERMSAARASESPAQHAARLQASQERMSAARASESPAQHAARLQASQERMSAIRVNESLPRRSARLQANQDRMSAARAAESSAQRNTRLQSDRSQHAAATASAWHAKVNDAFGYNPAIPYEENPNLNIGRMSIRCEFCGALKWKREPPGLCCSSGKVRLPTIPPPPEPMYSLLLLQTPQSEAFLRNIRLYNSLFAMTSFAAHEVNEAWMPTFKIQGQVYHRIGALFPASQDEAAFLQIYFLGNEESEVQRRSDIFPTATNPATIRMLQKMLHDVNNYIRSFKTAIEHQQRKAGGHQNMGDFRIVIRADKRPPGQHPGRYNEPVADEVAVLMVGEGGERDIVLHSRNAPLQRIRDLHRSYDPLQYPLLFCRGEDGYDCTLMQVDPRTRAPSLKNKVTSREYYAYRIMFRANDFNSLLRSQRLTQQYIVDMFAKVENERLRWLRGHQKDLRAEEYGLLRDAVANDNNVTADNVGRLVVLPSSFTGSPRYMHEHAQDAMTYVRKRGTPDLFITFTCNPNWPEIVAELLPGQVPVDRVDLVARVFKQKVIKMMEVICKVQVFGPVACYIYSIEWQKRGLPHMHLLVWLHTKIRPSQIDSIISAEIPDQKVDPHLFEVVTSHMIHGPFCNRNPNSPCIREGKCSKRYPRQLLKETQTGEDGYPQYRRRSPEDWGRVFSRRMPDGSELPVDNSWVVPYCPLLSRLFHAHINVEYCNSIKSIKYVCKYVMKGSDAAMFAIVGQADNRLDEISTFQQGRYYSSSEAVWRLLNFDIHERYPTVVHLAVHLEGGQRVFFRGGQPLPDHTVAPRKTTLTAFFEICKTNPLAKTLLYCDMPRHFTWSGQAWKPRKIGIPLEGFPGYVTDDALGRVYTVHPNNREAFHLRLLLHHIPGPTSFEDLKLIRVRDAAGNITGQKQCSTFVEACHELGLLEDDSHWNLAMQEATVSRSPAQIRDLFAILVASCGLNSPVALWNEHKESMTEDYLRQARHENPTLNIMFCEALFNKTLIYLDDKVYAMNGNRLDLYGLPKPVRTEDTMSKDILRETCYNVQSLSSFVSQNEPRLTPDQRVAYVAITAKLRNGEAGIVFLDAPGGTGKTFLLNLLLAFVRKEKRIALAVASSGIAATLLAGGRTAHSAFKLPLNLTTSGSVTCNISKGTSQAHVLQQCQLIVWDEATMSHRNAFQALDKTLQDLRGNNLLMGGVPLVLSGDFRQTLPIVTRGTPADEIKACLKSSYLWPQVSKFRLSTNMRSHIQGDPSAGAFAQRLLAIGDGRVPEDPATGQITLPCGIILQSASELRERVYPSIWQNYRNQDWLCERAILAARNETVDEINHGIQKLIPGPEHAFKSIDTVLNSADAVQYPAEFLNSIQTPDLQPHNLVLRVGSPIMLMRNIDAPRLCNGTRLIVKQLLKHVIQATIMTGSAKGEDVFIPRIPIIPSDETIPFKRTQFPVKLCYAMTINKAQGQSLKLVGVDLRTPCFAHGQLYVACSRVGREENLFFLAPNGKSKNVVNQRALQ